MAVSFHPFRALTSTAGAFRDDLAASDEQSGDLAEALRGQLDQLAATWAFALAALICAPAVVAYAAFHVGRADLLRMIEVRGGVLVGLGLVALALLKMPAFARWSPHSHVRAATLIGAGIGTGLYSLLRITAAFPASALQLASFGIGFAFIAVCALLAALCIVPVRGVR